MRTLLRLVVAFVFVGAAHGSFSTCTHECDDCEGPFYTTNADGSCATRSSHPVQWYCHDFTCRLDRMQFIRDEESCSLASKAGEKSHEGFGLLGYFGHEYSPSTGCMITSTNVKFLELGSFKGQICFGMIRWDWLMLSQFAAVVFGIIAGFLSGKFERLNASRFHKHLADKEDVLKEFGPGAKAVAMHNVVSRCHYRYVMSYRCCQVIANVWLPAMLLWLFSPRIVLPLSFILYFLPACFTGGFDTLSNPQYLITTRACSLFGIREDQKEDAYWGYLLSIVRPPLLVCLVIVICEIVKVISVKHEVPLSKLEPWLINRGNFVQLGFQTFWGDLLAKSVFWITIVGTGLYMLLTLRPACKTLFGMSTANDCITLESNEDKLAQFKELTKQICDAAGADDEEDSDEEATRVDAITETVISRRVALFLYGMAFVDFIAYIYKVYAFLRAAKYFAGGVMTFALVESLTVLVYHSRFRHAREAFERTAKTGIPTVNFLALCQWDDGIAGIPALFLSIYGLPLLEMGPLAALSSLFFLLTGTRALAHYLGDCADAAMWEVAAREKDEYVLIDQGSQLLRDLSSSPNFFLPVGL